MTDFNADIENCLAVLQAGGVILYPTDTIWGLGCDATNAAAVDKLIAIKGKPLNKGLIVILANERDLIHYVANLNLEAFNYLETVEKPTTVIYENGLEVADNVLNNDGSIAIRLVKEDFCRHLLKRFKKPVVSTSANLHTQPSPQFFKDIPTELKQQVDYVVKYRQDDQTETSASTIVKWQNEGGISILRK
ncbi:MAG: translation factor [Segetibacter sp.]|nr:translation factor [Segetibacter sp.]